MTKTAEYPAKLDVLPVATQNQTDDVTGEPDLTYTGPSPTGEGHHALNHNYTNAAVMALEKELGTDPSGSLFSTVKARLENLDRVFNVKAFGAVGNGSTEDHVAFKAAFEAAKAVNGVVVIPVGTYLFGLTVQVPSNIMIIGEGWTSSIIKAKTNLNAPLLEAENTATTGAFNSELMLFCLDGNKSNNTESAGFKGQIQSFYFVKMLARNCDKDAFSVKLTTENQQQISGLDNVFQSCRAINCEGNGFTIEAHDTIMRDCQAIQCKENGFKWLSNGYMEMCHCWCFNSEEATVMRTGYRLEGNVKCFNCVAEGASERQVLFGTGSNNTQWIGGWVFASTGKPNATAFEWNGGTSICIYGPQISRYGTGGAFKFTTDGQNSVIQGFVFDPESKEAVLGEPHDNNYFDVQLGGSTLIGTNGARMKRMNYTFSSFTPGSLPKRTLYYHATLARLRLRDHNAVEKEVALQAGETLASATTIAPTPRSNLIKITGVAEIKKVTATFEGHEITLKFAESLKVVKGENLKISANFEATADDTLTLICDGTNWYEKCRSAN